MDKPVSNHEMKAAKAVKVDGKTEVPVYAPGTHKPDGTLVLDFKTRVSEPLPAKPIEEKIADEWDDFNGDVGGRGPILFLIFAIVVSLAGIGVMTWVFWS